MNRKAIFSSKLVLSLLVIFLGLMANLKYKQWQSQKAIEAEKRQLSGQIDSLEKQNSDLSASLQYLNSGDFKERAARNQLNLKRNGELVYNFTSGGTGPGQAAQGAQGRSNLQKWWDYFTASQ